MGHLIYSDSIDINPYFNGSISQLFLVKSKNTLVVKSLKPDFCDQVALKERFTNEADILRSLQSDHTPTFIKSNLSSKRPYFAYQYIDGVNLTEIINAQSLSIEQSTDILRQLLTALSSLHKNENTIIHSDITPDNIIVATQGTVHLIDFGCACKLNEQQDSAHTWIGKHAYLSPEQAQGHQWGQQSDLYQAGLIFYEMLTGQRRNTGQTNKDRLPMAANPVSLDLDDIDPRYHTFIDKLLADDSTDRYQTAEHALSELNKL